MLTLAIARSKFGNTMSYSPMF